MMRLLEQIRSMGEAIRRKEQGLAPKGPKERGSKVKTNTPNVFAKYQILPYILVGFLVAYLLYDLIKYYV